MNVERADTGDDDEVRQNERPAAGPGAPEAGAHVRNIDADLNGEWPWQRLADGDRLAHLVLGQPVFVGNQLALHLTDQRDRAAEAEQPEPEEVGDEFADPAGRTRRL